MNDMTNTYAVSLSPRRLRLTAVWVALACGLTVGCVPGMPAGNANGGGQAPPGNAGNTPALTDGQRAAVNDVVAELRGLGVTLAAMSDFDNQDTPPDAPAGTCPVKAATLEPGCFVLVTQDFGPACSGPRFGDAVISGTVTECIVSAAGDRTPDLSGLVINDVQIGGTAVFTVTPDTTDGGTRDATVDITTSTTAAVQGDIVLDYDAATGVLNLLDATLTVTTGSAAYEIAVTAIDMDPGVTGTFMPVAGSVTFDVPPAGAIGDPAATIGVTFTAESPIDGVVGVTVAGGDAILHQIPGVAR